MLINRAPAKRVVRACVVLAALYLAGAGAAATADTPRRVVSINACTDQLLWALADRHQIAAITRLSANPVMSPYAAEMNASGIPYIRGTAEEVIKRGADLVLAGSYTGAATRARLAAFGMRLETFAPAESIQGVKDDIARVAALLGHPDRGQAMISDIDAAVEDGAVIVPDNALRVVHVERAAYIAGGGTLFDDILARLGVGNAGRDLGVTGIVQTRLETILKLEPDALVLFDALGTPSDQGASLLFHPALEARFPASRRIVLPGNQILCGGPLLATLIRSAAKALAQITPRSEGRDQP